MSNILDIFIHSIVLLSLDSLFLYNIRDMFSKQIISVQKEPMRINMYGAVACYIFLILALDVFIIQEHASIYKAMILGLVLYGVYETTTYALLKNWKLKTVIIDTLWGALLFGLTVYLSRFILSFL